MANVSQVFREEHPEGEKGQQVYQKSVLQNVMLGYLLNVADRHKSLRVLVSGEKV